MQKVDAHFRGRYHREVRAPKACEFFQVKILYIDRPTDRVPFTPTRAENSDLEDSSRTLAPNLSNSLPIATCARTPLLGALSLFLFFFFALSPLSPGLYVRRDSIANARSNVRVLSATCSRGSEAYNYPSFRDVPTAGS